MQFEKSPMAENHSALIDDDLAGEQGHPFLQQLGERVRRLRSARGMSRKILARQAEVSERYLAQLEGGTGNWSVLLLRRIAQALSLPLAQLIDDRPETPVESTLFGRFLERLSPAELAEARELLVARFGGAAATLRQKRIALIGLRGGGKSTIGRLLGERLRLPFVELDREIEALSGTRLSEIFEMFGQETYRRTERAALEGMLRKQPRFVVATGGSIVSEAATFELLLTSCFTIWVRASPDAHMQRVVAQGDLRPMAENARAMDDLLAILRSREPLYAKADIVLDTEGKTPDACVQELIGRLRLDHDNTTPDA